MERPKYPPPAPPPRHSNVLTYVVVLAICFGIVLFLFLLFGELFVIALAVFLSIDLLYALHYFTWGRAMTEQAKKDAKANLESE